MTDTDRIDYLETLDGHFQATEVRNLHSLDMGTAAYLKGFRVQFFSVPSQWVYGIDLRHAIDTAMAVAGKEKKAY